MLHLNNDLPLSSKPIISLLGLPGYKRNSQQRKQTAEEGYKKMQQLDP
jgi:hypothetical protein